MRYVYILGLTALSILGTQAARAQDLTQDINSVVTADMAEYQIPGVMVGVWQGNTQIAYVGDGYGNLGTPGVTPPTPIAEDEQFKIGSVTKSMTVTLLLELADQGKVNLNDPISNYVTGLSGTLGSATLLQLANMTSGIPNYSSTDDFKAEVAGDPTGTIAWTDSKLISYANTVPPIYAPGAGPWNYSNTNTVLLGMVVAKITGQPLQTSMNSMFASLNMNSTIFPNSAVNTPTEPYLHGYQVGNDPNSDVSNALPAGIFSGAGAVYSTLDDLAIWGRVLGKGTLLTASIQSQRLTLIPAGQAEGTSNDMPYYDSYGLGIGSINGWIGHTGDQPGYGDLVLYDPSTDRTIVIVSNLGLGNNVNYATNMFLDMQSILAVPEPPIYSLLGIGVLFILGIQHIRRKSSAH